jgi:RNA polymerase sigma factor (sigma-70 family)
MAPAEPFPVSDDTAIQDQLVAAYGELRGELLRFLAARLGNMAAAEDVYQELYLRLRAAVPAAELRDARSFIYRSAYNLANEQARAMRRREARDAKWIDQTTDQMGGEAVAPERAADEVLAAKERLKAVSQAIAALPPRCREVFTLCRVRGLGHREVAESLGISTKAVEKHITAALKHLAAALQRHNDAIS